MASDYGRNFGFRVSGEGLRLANGNNRTPASGSALMIGTAVQVDADTEGYLKACASNAELVPGYSGLLIQEESHLPSIYDAQVVDSYSRGISKLNTLSVISSGAGVTVWFKNTAAESREDGRAISAVTMTVLTGVTVGAQLGWNGTYWVLVDGSTVTQAWLTVTAVETDYVEAVMIK